MYIRKQRLLTPGPTPLYPPALHAMMASDIHHRTEDFRKVYRSMLADLKEVYGTANDVLCFAASGTGAMDASVTNLFSRGDKVIVCSAGKFGERWGELARAYELDMQLIDAPYGDAIAPERVEAALKAEPSTKGVFIQASESSTGAEHDVKSIGEIVKRTDALFIVDAITGLGTMPLDIEAWGLDVVIGGSQKAFMIPPGLAFLSVSAKAWKKAESATLPHFYFDLKKEKKNGDAGESAWTPAVSLVLGMANLIANAQMLARATRAAAGELGLEVFAKRPGSSVTGLKSPAGMDSGAIVKAFRERFGAVITNGQGSMKGQMFRLAHLGYFDISDMFCVIAALEIILRANGHRVELGKGVAAVQRVYEEAV
jgi:aspartate aminotransferase-like enzyme